MCLYPDRDLSGYRIPLNEEIGSSSAIAIGKVIAEKRLNDGPGGPDFILATIYSVRVEKVLKGRLPRIIKLRTENDSGRYVMDVGDTHILFLRPMEGNLGADYSADSCGNSTTLPKGQAVVKKVQTRIDGTRHAP